MVRRSKNASILWSHHKGSCLEKEIMQGIGADFRFEVPGQSSVGLIGGERGQWLGGTMASAEHEPIMGVWGRSPSGVQGQSPCSGGQGGEAP